MIQPDIMAIPIQTTEMPIGEYLPVATSVASVANAYQEALELIREIRKRGHARGAVKCEASLDAAAEDLELSLVRGQEVIRSQYDRDYRRLGKHFAEGDELAKNTLMEIVQHLQCQVIYQLQLEWRLEFPVEYLALQDVSDESQDQTIMCLMQLHQRLLTAASMQDESRFSPTSIPWSQHESSRSRSSPRSSWETQPVSSPQMPSLSPPSKERVSKSVLGMHFRRRTPTEYEQIVASPSTYDSEPAITHQLTKHPSQRSRAEFSLRGNNGYPASLTPPKDEPFPGVLPDYRASRLPSLGSLRIRELEEPLYPDRLAFSHWSVSDQGSERSAPSLSHNRRGSEFSSYSRNSARAEFESSSRTHSIDQDAPSLRNYSSTAVHAPPPLVPLLSYQMATSVRPSPRPSRPHSPSRAMSSASQTHYRQQRQLQQEQTAQEQAARSMSTPDGSHPHSRQSFEQADRSGTSSRRTIVAREHLRGMPLRVQSISKISFHDRHSGHSSYQTIPNGHYQAMMQHTRNNSASDQSIASSGYYDVGTVPNTPNSYHTSSSFSSMTSPSAGPMAPMLGLMVSKAGFLPAESNKYAGLCKGAWRLQIGERKKALEERSRPRAGTVSIALSFWKCQKCNFEGRMSKDADGKKSVDRRIFGSDGLLYRWEFLFKSHVAVKDAFANPLDSTFGCVFCCAEGRSTPLFSGVEAFLKHLQEHRVRLPSGEILYRMGCISGRTPGVGEEFDVALPLP